MTTTHILGFPRIGKNRELKSTVEAYWAGKIDQSTLLHIGEKLRRENWEIQHQAGLDFVSVGDFSWYDQVLDMAMLLGVVPQRFQNTAILEKPNVDTLFRMARGRAPTGIDALACEMTKWFDTNYHYIVPEIEEDQYFHLGFSPLFKHIQEAQALGYPPKPVIIGPLTFLWLAKSKTGLAKLPLLGSLVECYVLLLKQLRDLQIPWVQIDEPILCLDLPLEWKKAFEKAYARLSTENISLLLTTYFDTLGDNLKWVNTLPVAGVHFDLSTDKIALESIIKIFPKEKVLSAGIVNGRNIWRTDLRKHYPGLSVAQDQLGDKLWIGSSCSLLHVPVDVASEKTLAPEIKSWLAFAVQKVEEIVTIATCLETDQKTRNDLFMQSDTWVNSRQYSTLREIPSLKERMQNLPEDIFLRKSPYPTRKQKQDQVLALPLFPTATIGSFPQTSEIRQLRKEYKKGEISEQAYEDKIRAHIKKVVLIQEELGLDVLVHGEAERNDMVEYFGEKLQGFAFTENGWVQSYGSRCVKPPIIYGDVMRHTPMTLQWSMYAQSLTKKPIKGLVTGPVTMLCWSFVRDDQPYADTAKQIALALRDEIIDLENHGIKIIQIDEPAFREGLPLRRQDWAAYLDWAVKAFLLASSGVQDSTQIQTHMCYSEFNEVIQSIAALDADVITMETSRSPMDLLEAFQHFAYPNEIGPGVYDVHSPRVPTTEEMVDLLEEATRVIPPERIWVNPDCGLKTRDWEETQQALHNMIAAAKKMREKYNNIKKNEQH